MAESLGRAFAKENLDNKLKGIQITSNMLPVTHQQFTDDNLLLGRA